MDSNDSVRCILVSHDLQLVGGIMKGLIVVIVMFSLVIFTGVYGGYNILTREKTCIDGVLYELKLSSGNNYWIGTGDLCQPLEQNNE